MVQAEWRGSEELEQGKGFQIFIKTFNEKSHFFRVSSLDYVVNLKQSIENPVGYHADIERFLHAGKQRQDLSQLQDYNISRNYTIVLTLKLQGGASEPENPGGSISYKGATRGKESTPSDLPQ